MFASLLYKLSKSPFVLPVYVPFQFSTIEHFISYPCIYRWFLYVSWILLMQWFYFIQLTVASIHLGNIVITHTLRMLCLCPLFFPDIRTYIYICVRRLFSFHLLVSFCWAWVLFCVWWSFLSILLAFYLVRHLLEHSMPLCWRVSITDDNFIRIFVVANFCAACQYCYCCLTLHHIYNVVHTYVAIRSMRLKKLFKWNLLLRIVSYSSCMYSTYFVFSLFRIFVGIIF